MEREKQTYLQKNKEATPEDDRLIKVLKFSKKLDVVQVGAGGVALVAGVVAAPILVPIGAGIIAWNGAEYVATDRIIKWRERKLTEKAKESKVLNLTDTNKHSILKAA